MMIRHTRRTMPRVKIPITVTIDADILAIVDRIRDQQGTPVSQMVDRALRLWLEDSGAIAKQAERRRDAPRRRP